MTAPYFKNKYWHVNSKEQVHRFTDWQEACDFADSLQVTRIERQPNSNVIKLHPPKLQHTTSAMMEHNLRVVRRRMFWSVLWYNFCWSMTTVFAVTLLIAWLS